MGDGTEVRDVIPGLWLWTIRPSGLDKRPDFHVRGVWRGGDPPRPQRTDRRSFGIMARLDARPPTVVVILKPDHIRDVDLFTSRYGAKAFGPWLFFRHDIPETDLEPIEPGSPLPGGLVALYDGRGRNETPLWLPEQRTLVFADGLNAQTGELRVWASPSHEDRALPALRSLLRLPFDRVIVSHGEPVHDRATYEQALDLPPWHEEGPVP